MKKNRNSHITKWGGNDLENHSSQKDDMAHNIN